MTDPRVEVGEVTAIPPIPEEIRYMVQFFRWGEWNLEGCYKTRDDAAKYGRAIGGPCMRLVRIITVTVPGEVSK